MPPWPRAATAVAAGFAACLAAASVLLALRFPEAWIAATREDRALEWAQFWCFAASAALTVPLLRRAGRRRAWFALLALACLYTAGEEVSWGQRLVGFEAPETFRRLNLQGETNLHNLVAGPFATGLKQALGWTMSAALLLYGVGFPAGLARGLAIARRLESLGLPAPPLGLWPPWTLAALTEPGPFALAETEVAELLVALALASTVLAHRAAGAGPGGGRRLVVGLAGLVGVVGALAAASTAWLAPADSAPAGRERRDMDLVVFAGRYARLGLWRQAEVLYARAVERAPGRPALHRGRARALARLGDAAGHDREAGLAVAAARRLVAARPQRIAGHVELALALREAGEDGSAAAARALELANRLAQAEAGSALAEYWLGEAERARGDGAAAERHWRRAHELEPANPAYLAAWIDRRFRLADAGLALER